MRYLDGSCYAGAWRAGERQGQGRLRTPAGDVFVGGFVDGRHTGPGALLMVRCLRQSNVGVQCPALLGDGQAGSCARRCRCWTAHSFVTLRLQVPSTLDFAETAMLFPKCSGGMISMSGGGQPKRGLKYTAEWTADDARCGSLERMTDAESESVLGPVWWC